MTTAHSAAINGESLAAVDSRVIVVGISSDAAKNTQSSASIYGRPGQRVTGEHRDYLDISVQFALRIKKNDMAGRSELFEKVIAWGMKAKNGAWLTVGHKGNRRAWVKPQQWPAEGDPWQWTTVYTITFRAWEVPYWQDETSISIRRAGINSLAQQISVNGNARTVLEISYTNGGSGACNTASFSTGTAKMSFSGLGLAAGEMLIIDHSNEGTLRIRIRSTAGAYRSAMAKRDPGSSDDLWIEPGAPGINIQCGQVGSFEISSRGRWV